MQPLGHSVETQMDESSSDSAEAAAGCHAVKAHVDENRQPHRDGIHQQAFCHTVEADGEPVVLSPGPPVVSGGLSMSQVWRTRLWSISLCECCHSR